MSTFVGLVIVFESEACMQLVNVGIEGNLHQNIVFISFHNVLIEDFSLLYRGSQLFWLQGFYIRHQLATVSELLLFYVLF